MQGAPDSDGPGAEDLARFARAGRRMSGIEFLRAMETGELPLPPMLRTLGIEPVEVGEGRTAFAVVPRHDHYNPAGVVHGGLAATLCDTAMACAIYTLLPAGANQTTLELKVNYVRAVTVDTGRVTCEGKVIHLGSRTATCEASVVDEDGELLAHGTTTCMVFRPAEEEPDG